MDGPNLEAHYQTWAQVWRHHNPGIEISDAELRQRYADWVEAEESLLARDRIRWEPANWGYPPLPESDRGPAPRPLEQTVEEVAPPVARPAPAKPPSRIIPDR